MLIRHHTTKPIIKKKIITDSIILQHFEGRDVLSINSKDIETTNSNSTEVLNNKVNTVQSDSKEYKESPDKINPEKPKYNKNAVDINNIWISKNFFCDFYQKKFFVI